MSAEILTAFMLSAVVLAAAPGPDILYVMAQGALYGVRPALLVVLGLCTGLLLHTLLAAAGLSALIMAHALLFTAVKVVGAAYLLYLAWQALQAGRAAADSTPEPLAGRELYVRGLLMNAANPKVIIFFLAFFPQFVPQTATSGEALAQLLVQGLLFMLAALLVFSAAAMLAGRLRRLLTTERAGLYLNWVTALILTVLAGTALLA